MKTLEGRFAPVLALHRKSLDALDALIFCIRMNTWVAAILFSVIHDVTEKVFLGRGNSVYYPWKHSPGSASRLFRGAIAAIHLPTTNA
jgi:hypothetical protein